MSSLPQTIKALQIQGNKSVKVVDIPFASQDKVQNLPEDEVLVRVRAVGLNPTDWKHAFGHLGTPGTIVGCDASGDVVAAGSAVTHVKVGDRVSGFNFGGSWQKDNGAYAEYVRFKAAVCFVLPTEMTYEEAASFPIPHLTAVQALYMRHSFPQPLTLKAKELKQKGEKILIWGASTAVGHHAVQLAALSGLEVYATASPAVHADIKALGAAHVFDYRDSDVASKIKEAAGDQGIVYAFDTVAENGSAEATIDAMSPTRGGTVITLLPISDEVKNRRKDVHAEFTLVYTALGYAFEFARSAHFPALPEDKARTQVYCAEDIHRVLDGWKAGAGAPNFQTQKLRFLPGGIEGIEDGLKIMQSGAYGREKLVCKFD
ncbi:GroES-like protein [Peniophora sp. CONT]|nr:GroES-like protein [Peniophora sp. CONT]